MNITDCEKIYQCFNRSSNGFAGLKDGEWYILKGSRIAEDDTPSYRKNGRTAKLMKTGIIVNDRFTWLFDPSSSLQLGGCVRAAS